jgi:hypothetical protein
MHVLETMLLVSCKACPGLGCVSVRSTSLRKLVLSDDSLLGIEELIIEDAPNLEYLMLSANEVECYNVIAQHTTKLQVLGFISAKFKMLPLGGDYFVHQVVLCLLLIYCTNYF